MVDGKKLLQGKRTNSCHGCQQDEAWFLHPQTQKWASSMSVTRGWGEERWGQNGRPPFTLLSFLPGTQVWVCDPRTVLVAAGWKNAEEGRLLIFPRPEPVTYGAE